MPYIVLQDADSQQRADERRNEILLKQDEQTRQFWRERLGFVETQPPRIRRQFYLSKLPVFSVTVDLDGFLEAVDHPDTRAEFWATWGPMAASLFDVNPPPGPVMGPAPIDPLTGQQGMPQMIDPGPPNYQLRQTVWAIERARMLQTDPLELNSVRDMGALLEPYWRERWFYHYQPVLDELRDMRKVLRE